jgi:hypothetical protein
MDPISAEIVEKTFTKLLSMSETEAFQLSYRLQKEQPLLVAYLAAVDEGILNQEERELLFYLGMVVWQIMSGAEKPLPKITEKTLLRIEKENLKMAESLKEADTVKFAEVVKKILQECRQPEVFRYVVAALMDEEEEEDNGVRDETLGIIMLDLKTVIDCFDR